MPSGLPRPTCSDIIAVPTADLPGPSMDNAPEVITNCQAGSVDTVYPVTGGAALGQQACGTYPSGESSIGNTTSNTLNYIPTPGLASFEPVAVVEQVPGSLYVSASGIPPQLTSIAVSGSQATFNYTTPVVCQTTPGDSGTLSQFTYSSPWWTTSRSGLTHPTAIACPADNATTAITLTYPGPVPTSGSPVSSSKGMAARHFIVGAPGTQLSGAREASQSADVRLQLHTTQSDHHRLHRTDRGHAGHRRPGHRQPGYRQRHAVFHHRRPRIRGDRLDPLHAGTGQPAG